MSGRLLVIIRSGSEDEYSVRWGLRLALHAYMHPYGGKILDDVKVLLFGRGVTIVNRKMPYYEKFREQIQDLRKAGIEVSACVSITKDLDLKEEMEELGVKLVHASVYISQLVSKGYTVMSW